jgi:hypothetical protein
MVEAYLGLLDVDVSYAVYPGANGLLKGVRILVGIEGAENR